MKRIAHTVAVIGHWQKDAPPELAATTARHARALKIRLSASLAQRITGGAYAGNPNDLLRDLSAEIRDRVFLTELWALYDAGERARLDKRTRKTAARSRRPVSLDEKLRAAAPARADRLAEALREEGRLRAPGLPPEMLRDHCHIFRKHFDWTTAARLRKILALSDAEFHERMCRFATELALAAEDWRTAERFDWKRFGYAGFDRHDFRNFVGERRRHLDTLGLGREASLEAIRRQYKILAKQHHPDLGGDAGRMRDLNEAYTFLTRTED